MKICDKHLYLMTGDNECWQCEKESLLNLTCQLQQDINLGNAVIVKQKQEISDLKEQLQKLQ